MSYPHPAPDNWPFPVWKPTPYKQPLPAEPAPF
jgi:hypothetical protein